MRVLVTLVAAGLLVAPTVFAQPSDSVTPPSTRPSETSLRQLLETMQAQKMLQAVTEQMDSMFDGMLKKQLEGRDLTPEQQKSLQDRQQAAREMIKQLLSWDSMEALYLKVYGDTFTQEEIDGMTAFYASPTGHAVIAKLPLVSKNTMIEMQQRMQQMMPKLQQMAKETADQIKAQDPPKKGG